MKVTVLVPSYRRPADLLKCLSALQAQQRPADEVLVIARTDDHETRDAVATALANGTIAATLPLRIVDVQVGGQVAALNAGLAASQYDITCITDDDATPHPDWIARIVAHFTADPKVGGVGGRDWVHHRGQPLTGTRDRVGVVEPTGRVIGNHHLGAGAAREVDVLKGANMSYRTAVIKAIGFDRRLRGTGAQVHNDLSMSLSVRRAGWKLIYDPQVQVNHYPAERFDEDGRNAPSVAALTNAAYNLHRIMLDHFGARGPQVCNWYRMVGTRDVPGYVQVLRQWLRGDKHIMTRFRATRQGAADAMRDNASGPTNPPHATPTAEVHR
ncbi:glycosyltransferase family 2 protein [Robbsia sp. KACC 23696]|uniref:glycosyltransferase n=1 Tax=Robbsia sp. KACC 23696 TaxID=3149231 RepID=UPI00325AEF6E